MDKEINTGGGTAAGQKKNDVLLFTTCDLGGERLDEVRRLQDSIRGSAADDGVCVRHYLLLQRAKADIPPDLAAPGYALRTIAIPDRVSLSRARNILLAQAWQEGAFDDALWAAFPDDDAWYPPNLLREVSNLFTNSASVDLVTCAYGSQPRTLPRGEACKAFRSVAGYGQLVRTVSSNTLMLRASVVAATGFFDERLGIGAPINGGEDLDYALRAYMLHARQALMSTEMLVGHRDRVQWVRSRYFSGSLFALARGARRSPGLAAQVVRKLAVGTALVATRELAPSDLWRGIRTGLDGWRRQEPQVATMSPSGA